jgi:hypothetical protein
MPDAAGTLVKMYWSIVGQEVQISVSMEFKIFKQGGWVCGTLSWGLFKGKKKKKKKKKNSLSHLPPLTHNRSVFLILQLAPIL